MMSSAEFYREVKENIAQHGVHLQGVFAGRDELPGFLPFIYTIGMAERGLPELLVVGKFPTKQVGALLNMLCEEMREKKEAPTPLKPMGGRFPLKCVWASGRAKTDYTIQAGRHLGHEEYAVMQVILCDFQGRYPGEPGCDPLFEVPLV